MLAVQTDLAMKLVDAGISDAKVQQGLKQLQKKVVNAGRKLVPSTGKRTDTGKLLCLLSSQQI